MKITTIIVVLLILLAAGVVALRLWRPKPEVPFKGAPIIITPQPEQEVVHDPAKFEKSKQLAEEAVKNAPTYKFDGMDLRFVSSAELPCADCWEFTFSFSSRQAGYGERKGQILAQVITPHQIKATIQNEKVTALVTDQTFDELSQRFLK